MQNYANTIYIYSDLNNQSNDFDIFSYSSSGISSYEKDRMTIIFSEGFKRLANKTQVFSNIEGSNGHKYRTRLTHSLEVAQLSSNVANILGLNNVLAEILGLSHDIAHACFGHMGQDALNEVLMRETGGKESFEHNSQAIRLFTILEPLNISPIIIDGLRKRKEHGLSTPHNYGESQVMNKVDAITYIAGDIQDSLVMKKLSHEQLSETSLIHAIYNDKDSFLYLVKNNTLNDEIIHRDILNFLTFDLVKNSQKLIMENQINSPYDFMLKSNKYGGGMISHSEDIFKIIKEIKSFMFENVYASKEMQKERKMQKEIIQYVFYKLMREPEKYIGDNYMKRYLSGKSSLARTVCDYIAGCDDKYIVALSEQKN